MYLEEIKCCGERRGVAHVPACRPSLVSVRYFPYSSGPLLEGILTFQQPYDFPTGQSES